MFIIYIYSTFIHSRSSVVEAIYRGRGGEWGKSVGVGGKEYGECEVEFHLKIQYK